MLCTGPLQADIQEYSRGIQVQRRERSPWGAGLFKSKPNVQLMDPEAKIGNSSLAHFLKNVSGIVLIGQPSQLQSVKGAPR